ncbi:MAG: HD domain-containing protein [Planctomycetales bacterium]|nr:HD domain-containing protein [Planctomycetales bacterium]
MDAHLTENLAHDPIHGYIRFVAPEGSAKQEICERHVIDHPWVQRMRQIRQLQTAWWVFPTAEHSRFQHIMGVMHLASMAVDRLYDSLVRVDSTTPEKPYVDSLMRMAGLLHDVGHGPFGHFFDAHYLAHFDLTHEKLGALIIQQELKACLAAIRRSPSGQFGESTQLSAGDVAWLIQRPSGSLAPEKPRWLHLLRSLFCGIYTVDNMDFVLRDAFMTGLSPRSFDLFRLLHYSTFTEHGLTVHERGMPALVHFLSMKADLFRSVYFHRTVRAMDLELADLFHESRQYLFPGDPREHLADYLQFTEFSLLTDVKRWHRSSDPKLAGLGQRWLPWLQRRVPWIMVCQRNVSFTEGQSESSSVFSSPRILSACVTERLPKDLQSLPFRIDLARHIHRPNTSGATSGMNFFFDSSTDSVRPLTTHGLYRMLPISHTIVRVYAHDRQHESMLAAIVDDLIGHKTEDDLTNM